MDDNACINSRTLYDIVWTCLTTIFACIWVSVHPNMPPQPKDNLPPQNESVLSLGSWRQYWFVCIWDGTSGIRRRLKTMLVALIAPEIIVAFAVRQWSTARNFSKEHGVSLTHGFFYSMGGFVDAKGHPIVDEQQLTPSILAAIRAIPQADIEDKSKSDGLAKFLAITQILRIVAQSLARWNQHLAITSLEIATVAYAVVTASMWFFWINKPLDTHTVIQIIDKPSLSQPSLQSHKKTSETTRMQPGSLIRTNTAHSWAAYEKFAGMTFGDYDHYDIHTSTDVSAFFSPPLSDTVTGIGLIIECAVALVFGVIHCIAWNTKFPSTAEKWMWRASAVIVTGLPVAWLVTIARIVIVLEGDDDDTPEGENDTPSNLLFTALAYLAFFSSILLYVMARVFLLVLPFAALRSLEPAVFIDISWVKYIPHL
ncbi:hypothetical protein R3P38DRAFT_3215468 [Favolaschia claudopus]|uniref:Uncharacterized protein n=1 Tax=Favolaschia claudopus TaxID=2862362 RepID=A0AAW0A8K1_9AGAR